MKTWDHVEYMLLPRMLALSEVVWSPSEAKDFDDFLRRLGWHFDRFDALGVRYRPLEGP
jgi:hexosaminidase